MSETSRTKRINVTMDKEGVEAERKRQFIHERGGLKSSLTRKQREIKELMSSENKEQVEIKLKELEETFTKFHDKHKEYETYIAGDVSDIESAYEYYQDTEQIYEAVRTEVNQWLLKMDTKSAIDSVKPGDSASQIGSYKSSNSSVRSSKLRIQAKKAALQIRAQGLERQQELKKKQVELEQLEQRLKIEEELAAITAEERVYEQFDCGKSASEIKQRTLPVAPESFTSMKMKTEIKSELNPRATEWRSTQCPSEEFQASERLANELSQPSDDKQILLQTIHQQQCAISEMQKKLEALNSPTQKMDENIPSNCECTHGRDTPTADNSSQYRDGVTGNIITTEERMVRLQQQVVDSMQLPKSELTEFDGDPLRYWMFIRAFDNNVGNTSVTESIKLNRLLQYCTGHALRVIECCSIMDPSEGYVTARKLLAERFGNQYIISQAWTKKITEGLLIKPADKLGLRKFADDVRSCVITLEAIGRLNEVDNQIRMVKIVDRLPFYLQSQWRKDAVRMLRNQGRYPDIKVLAKFIQEAAEEANDPVFGGDLKVSAPDNKPKSQTRLNFTKQRGTSFSVQTKDNQTTEDGLSCFLCSEKHAVYRCERFRQMSSDKRLEFTKENKLCFNCFSPKHMAQGCPKSYRCTIQDCLKKHSRLLHSVLQSGNSSESRPANGKVLDDNKAKAHNGHTSVSVSSSCGFSGAGIKRVALPIVPVKVRANKSQPFVTTYALLDNGSTNTFCAMELLNDLGAQGKNTKLSLTTLEKPNSPTEAMLTGLEVTDLNERTMVNMPNVLSTSNLPMVQNGITTEDNISRWPHLTDIPFHPTGQAKVSLLIGQDVPEALAPHEVKQGKAGQPYATRTIFGWTLNGPVSYGQPKNSVTTNFIHADYNLEIQVEKFWKLSSCESLADNQNQMSVEDKRVVKLWTDTTCVENGHYVIKIPFKQLPPRLPNNYVVAESRLETLGRKLRKDPELFERYKGEVHNLLDKGFAECVVSDHSCTAGKEWYLPHHAVFSEKKPDKLRLVFDCAAKYSGTSLNEEILQGPDFANGLVGVLLRFREHPVAVMGDIEAMFHQVKVPVDDRDVLRFLWWKNDDVTQSPEIFRMTVHLFGGVWSPSCATYALKRTSQEHSSDFDPEVAETVIKDFYVDDCLKSVPTERDAIELVHGLCTVLQRGGFKLNKWVSNSRQVLESIPQDQRSKGIQDIDLDKTFLPCERALGVQWDIETDELGIRAVVKDKPLTRRGLISLISSIYDPIGFVCPFILQAKIIFQAETRRAVGWDSPLKSENQQRWLRWTKQLPAIQEFRTPRCILPQDFGKIVEQELHHFSDASMTGYGAVSYLRSVNSDSRIHCTFLLGKSRLAPIKQLTIPRLELSAAVISVKLDRCLRREMNIVLQSSTFWTDSTIVLQYVKNESRRFQTFVANRVSVIHEASSSAQWNHVDSKDNPADYASRGADAQHLIGDSKWINGPDFLWSDKATWTQESPDVNQTLDNDPEVKRESKVFSTVDNRDNPVLKVAERFSSWYRLRKAISWLIRFKNFLICKVKGNSIQKIKGGLQVSEIRNAEVEILKAVQQSHYADEIQAIKSGRAVKATSSIYKLEPALNSKGVLCVGGRLSAAPVNEQAKHQAILPKGNHVSTLILRHCHEQSGHSGKEHVLAILRQNYWIVRARVDVKRILRECVSCARRKRKPGCQRMADLPADRVSPYQPPFSEVGFDCFGPYMVKRGRSEVKRYGCIFTCLSTRAIHLEKLDSMDTDSFLDAFRRFECRRGRPETVRTDNGSNFKGAERELKEAIQSWNLSKIGEHMRQKEIQWLFNPPLASHMGGVWERQIRTVRKVLMSLLGIGQTLTDEGLCTLFCEVESIVNSRPITAVSDDPKDLNPLTPNHILLLRSGSNLPLAKFCKEDGFRKRWKQVQFMADEFWRRWIREYLPTLQLRQKWIKPQRNFSEGDVVLLVDGNTPRLNWSLGRITRTFPGKDGHVRCAEVKTQWSVLTRPIDKLCLLEAALE